ncbi:hypothetical protein DFH27DRAFT_540867 [Peziza echinospora]|nr:hypothetical protein DFH27DRAFT_540867 [Peziza echinospora]
MAFRTLMPRIACARTFAPVQMRKISTLDSILSKPAAPAPTDTPTSSGNHLEEWDSIMAGGSFDPTIDEHHLHIYSTKHNTHITFTDPKKQPIISVSAGNIGFKKSHRGTYDAAYQLAAHVFAKLEEMRIRPKNMEVIMRSYGEGREAVIKALLGTEGRFIKGAIKRVTDSTRLKFGGTRSKKPRRLG